MSKLRKLFTDLDKDNNGWLSPRELEEGMDIFNKSYMESHGREPNWEGLMNFIDRNKTGKMYFT